MVFAELPITGKVSVIVEPLYCKRPIPSVVHGQWNAVNPINYNKRVITLLIVGAIAEASSAADVLKCWRCCGKEQ